MREASYQALRSLSNQKHSQRKGESPFKQTTPMTLYRVNSLLISNADMIGLYADDGTISLVGFINIFVTLSCLTNNHKPEAKYSGCQGTRYIHQMTKGLKLKYEKT